MTETLSPSFSETLPGYDPVDLEDLELRKRAKPLHSLDATVVRDPKDHPSFPAVCDVCGGSNLVLTHCGRPLCIPCQRKRVARLVPLVTRAVFLLKAERARILEAENKRLDHRFLTTTLKVRPGHSLASEVERAKDSYSRLRRTAFWRRCDVRGDLPRLEFVREVRFDLNIDAAMKRFDALIIQRLKSRAKQWHQDELDSPTESDVAHRLVLESVWNTALALTDWYVHVHSVVLSAFMPAGPEYERELKDKRARSESEGNLRDEWHKITGDSYIVKIESVRDDVSLARELVKYVEKPTDDLDESIESWPVEARQEAASTLAGPHRTRWYCHTHNSRSRSKCLDFKPRPGMKLKHPCDGEYRQERSGFRPLLPSGLFRCAIRAAKGQLNKCCQCCDWNKVKVGMTTKDFCIFKSTSGAFGSCYPTERVTLCAIRCASFNLPKREHNCRHCGLGKLRNLRWWESRGDSNAGIALNSIRAHETTCESDEPLGRHVNLMADMPAGWIPPPPFANYEPGIRLLIIERLEKEPRTLDDFMTLFIPGANFAVDTEAEDRLLDTVRLGLLSLENLGYIFRSSRGVYLVNPRMTKGLVERWYDAKKKLREDAPRADPVVTCEDPEDRADRWRSSSPFSGGLE